MQGKRWLMGAAAAALLLTMTAGCGDKGGQSGGGSGKLPINSVSLPEKLDGDVIKILGYAGWEAEHEEIRKILGRVRRDGGIHGALQLEGQR